MVELLNVSLTGGNVWLAIFLLFPCVALIVVAPLAIKNRFQHWVAKDFSLEQRKLPSPQLELTTVVYTAMCYLTLTPVTISLFEQGGWALMLVMTIPWSLLAGIPIYCFSRMLVEPEWMPLESALDKPGEEREKAREEFMEMAGKSKTFEHDHVA